MMLCLAAMEAPLQLQLSGSTYGQVSLCRQVLYRVDSRGRSSLLWPSTGCMHCTMCWSSLPAHLRNSFQHSWFAARLALLLAVVVAPVSACSCTVSLQ